MQQLLGERAQALIEVWGARLRCRQAASFHEEHLLTRQRMGQNTGSYKGDHQDKVDIYLEFDG
jgi:hypothetical protein